MSNALAVSRRPRFCPYNWNRSTREEEMTYQALLESQWQNDCLPQIPVKQFDNFDELMTRIFHRIRQLSVLAPEYRFRVDSEVHCRSIYSTHALITERHLNGSIWGDVLNEQRHENASVDATSSVFHVTCMIYVYLVLRELPTELVIYNKTVFRLKAVLESLDQSQSFGGLDTGFLLWVLIVGGTAALGRPERPWFVTLLTRLREVLNLGSWENAKMVLKGYAWVENSFAIYSHAFWEESERMEEIVDMYRI
jgi:hypothetical protein